MFNFTEEIKKEIIAKTDVNGDHSALLSAFIRTSGSIILKNGSFGFEIVTENERTAELFTALLEERYSLKAILSDAKKDLLSGKNKLVFECAGERAQQLLKEVGIVGEDEDGNFINFSIDGYEDEESKLDFIRGAFLGGGSCTLPEESSVTSTGYHFETVFSNKVTASGFCELLCDFEILSKLVSRKDKWVVYIKSQSLISDILGILGCTKSLEKLNKIVQIKDESNNANRVTNCSVSNIDKTVTASVNQVRAIEIIAETIGLQSLDKPLFDVAECRLADKNASMQELASRLGISKSCINHRIRKLSELAKSLSD